MIRFLAMEYYRLIWNRTFEVTVDESGCSGAFVRGAISTGSPGIVMAAMDDEPAHLVDAKRLDASREHPAGSSEYLAKHRFNFTWPRASILAIRFNPRKKWGMGAIPHDGRIEFERSDRSREFIVLGKDRAPKILEGLRSLGYARVEA